MAGNRVQVNVERARIWPLSPASWAMARFFSIIIPASQFTAFKDLLLSVGVRHGSLFPSQRSHGKKLVPAGCAAQRREPEDPPGNRSYTRHVLSRNALQFQVAANPAMSVEEGAKWQGVSVKS
jgi:hypothetical protein